VLETLEKFNIMTIATVAQEFKMNFGLNDNNDIQFADQENIIG